MALQAQSGAQFGALPGGFSITDPNVLFAPNVEYDTEEPARQAFDLFVPDTLGQAPLVIFIHGGGFIGGTRASAYGNQGGINNVELYLNQGVAFATLGYRLLPADANIDPEGVIKCLNDSKRALQFIRYHAEELHIDPARIVLYGGSAGAGTALWLGVRDDMADQDSPDPIEQMSTRVCAVAGTACQATYDMYRWETDVYDNYDGNGTDYTLQDMTDLLSYERYSSFYGGVDTLWEILYNTDLIQYRQDVDMLLHMSPDDPPLYTFNDVMAPLPSQNIFHHALHGRTMVEYATAANMSEVRADIPYYGINTTNGESLSAFLLRHLNSCALSTGTGTVDGAVSELLIYPNPCTQEFRIRSNAALQGPVEIFNVLGHRVKTWPNATRPIDVSDLVAGFYLVRAGGLVCTMNVTMQ